MQKVIWEVGIVKPPAAVRYCKKCGTRTEYDNSGFFRVNAQKKCLDIWLIYKCRNCDTTWNATLLTRTGPEQMDRDLLERFHDNDPGLVMRYAMDTELLKKNGAGLALPEYCVSGAVPDFTLAGRLTIVCDYPVPVRLSSVLRKKLELSRSQLERLLDEDFIRSEPAQDLMKCRLPRKMDLYWSPNQ